MLDLEARSPQSGVPPQLPHRGITIVILHGAVHFHDGAELPPVEVDPGQELVATELDLEVGRGQSAVTERHPRNRLESRF